MYAAKAEGRKSKLARTTMMVLAVTLHNIPEGMAVGIVYAGFLNGNLGISAGAALALSLGIAIQNFPEGAIISMPLHAEGESKMKALFYDTLRCGRTCSSPDNAWSIKYFYPRDAISSKLCSRSYDVCCSRGTYP